MKDVQFHESAELFRLMNDSEYDAFREDIRLHGLREPIVLHEGKILDGRNRYRACLELEIDPSYREWKSDGSPTAYVISVNEHRRHLTLNDKALIAVAARPMLEKEMTVRMSEGGRKGKRPPVNKGASIDAPLSTKPKKLRGRASREAGNLLGISPATVDRCRNVLDHGSESLIEAVKDNKVSVATGALIVQSLSKREQDALVTKGPEAIKEKASKLRKAMKPRAATTAMPELIARILADTEDLIGQIRKSSAGVSEQRKQAIEILRNCRHNVKRCCGFLSTVSESMETDDES